MRRCAGATDALCVAGRARPWAQARRAAISSDMVFDSGTVAAAVASGRADYGICIENVARGLRFRFLAEERFDFLIPSARRDRPAVRAFLEVLGDPATRAALTAEGFLA